MKFNIKKINFLQYFVLIFMLLLHKGSVAQVCIYTEEDEDWNIERAELENHINEGPELFKLIRVNIHYMLRADGTGNFTETGDNYGNKFSGYDFARDAIQFCNNKLSYNIKMNIPPDNTTVVNQKNYQYILDAVYFHRNNASFNYGLNNVNYNTYKENPDSVINIIFSNGGNAPAGHASALSPTSKIKYTEIRGVYKRYSDYISDLSSGLADEYEYEWVLHSVGKTLNHEIAHTLGLSHTVRKNSATLCLTNTCHTANNCDDGCSDTPSAAYIVDVLGGGHPACHWKGRVSAVGEEALACPNGYEGTTEWCSNNLMDYGQSEALTPCQLNIIHTGLEGGMFTYTLCDAIANDLTIYELTYPKMAYYGKKVILTPLDIGNITLAGREEANIYFSESVEFYPNLTIEGNVTTPDLYNNKMEVFLTTICD